MNILLIGHEGYLGQGLAKYFEKSHHVIGWDKKEDIFNLTGKILAQNEIEAVVNLSVAADLNSKTFAVDAPGDLVNVEGARHLARVLKGSEIRWFQFSTREVLGPVYGEEDVFLTDLGYRPKFFVDENQPYNPQNFYGKSKIIAEFLSESHPFSNVIRLTSPYTNFTHPAGGWVLRLIKGIVAGNEIKLTGGGLQFRDPLHTDDLGRLIESLCIHKISGEKIHAGGGENNILSLKEFVNLAKPNCPITDAPGGDLGFAFDNSKATRLTGWSPQVSIREKIPVIVGNAKEGILK